MKKILEIIKKKWLRDTFLTILLIVIIFAIYFGINYGVKKLNLKDIDLTTDKIYSISESTKTKLENLEKDVTIQLINMNDYVYLQDFANKYTQLNEHIKVERIDDLSSRPDIMNKYSLESTDILIIAKSGEKETVLSTSDLYTYDYTTYEQIDVTEEAITNAIIEVTIEDKPNVYFLEGHNYYTDSYFQLLKQDIKSESNEVNTLNILTKGSIPEDCDCLVITTLKEDLTEVEADKIIEYSNNGGKILLLSDANILGVEMPNFDKILEIYGFKISNGILIEQDENKMIYNSPEFIISSIESNSIITKNIKMNVNICLIDTGRIEFEDEDTLDGKGITYEKLATVSDSAFLRKNLEISTYNKTNQDESAGGSTVVALVTRNLNEDKKSEMIVFSNAIFATNQTVSLNNNYSMYANKLYNNDDVVINSISYLTKRSDTITIRKDYDSVTYNVTQTQHNIITAIIFLVPVAIIIVGIVVWQIRRRKK